MADISKNQSVEITTLPAGTTDINEYLAVGYDGELPAAGGAAVAGILSKTAYAGKAKSVVARGETFAVVGEAGVTAGDKLWANTTGKLHHTIATEIPCAIALEDGAAVNDVIKVIVISHGVE